MGHYEECGKVHKVKFPSQILYKIDLHIFKEDTCEIEQKWNAIMSILNYYIFSFSRPCLLIGGMMLTLS